MLTESSSIDSVGIHKYDNESVKHLVDKEIKNPSVTNRHSNVDSEYKVRLSQKSAMSRCEANHIANLQSCSQWGGISQVKIHKYPNVKQSKGINKALNSSLMNQLNLEESKNHITSSLIISECSQLEKINSSPEKYFFKNPDFDKNANDTEESEKLHLETFNSKIDTSWKKYQKS